MVTIRLRHCCAGRRVLAVCLGGFSFLGGTINVGATTGACFSGRPGSLDVRRTTALINVYGGPSLCGPGHFGRHSHKQHGIILNRVQGTKCLASTRASSLGTLPLILGCHHISRGRNLTACFHRCLHKMVATGRPGGDSCHK